MTGRVLVLGGRGRIGSQVAADLVAHTQAEVTITGRNPSSRKLPQLQRPVTFAPLALEDFDRLRDAIRSLAKSSTTNNVVVHCAGPFHVRDANVLKLCIEAGVNYVDVSDHPSFTRKAMAYQAEAEAAGITAIVNTGIFPGISNSMVRQGIEQLDQPEKIHLSYVVSGSGGAGLTVMRTTFLGLQHAFQAWIEGQWQSVKPYSDREIIEFPLPYGHLGVYWFDMPETFTLPDTFPVNTVITKFGSAPDLYNHLTWWVAHTWPPKLLKMPAMIEFLSRVGFGMTKVTDPISGIGVAIRSEITGQKDGQVAQCCSTLVHANTAVAAGCGTGSVVELLLSGKLDKPGVWPIEQALPTHLFEQTMQSRGIEIQHQLVVEQSPIL
jgi:saccharopine dehydrogenase-like NADP-dependent oxidoreductase